MQNKIIIISQDRMNIKYVYIFEVKGPPLSSQIFLFQRQKFQFLALYFLLTLNTFLRNLWNLIYCLKWQYEKPMSKKKNKHTRTHNFLSNGYYQIQFKQIVEFLLIQSKEVCRFFLNGYLVVICSIIHYQTRMQWLSYFINGSLSEKVLKIEINNYLFQKKAGQFLISKKYSYLRGQLSAFQMVKGISEAFMGNQLRINRYCIFFQLQLYMKMDYYFQQMVQVIGVDSMRQINFYFEIVEITKWCLNQDSE
ncbi:hypothetical protein TTHERM_00439350 (macronuclear) [Tetrahymena thermophila SB210]|uniref:Uncharacterized protein n=1 Tax=Tetrahymena thermophila (strain SB210) TaxID=312017 RepID=I7MET9_TETTS|nr:hypothetical protein TTHERM_00439350 [Tetrahymena thermophila SB210]EAR97587.2 hypothetical protein TTHERM_00439350 [Tetrahymena thermophila SB210]|eukprot:XP_001017832.2 hypothetical protein TTHERM_00439350 [Tetrahymena thermophila SB210]